VLNNPEEISDNLQTDGPLVSVGIPTYNRPEGLHRTLECITAQTYKNLEIIVSDNCSPGPQTECVIREFVAKDNRIQYYRQDVNKGSTFNFQFVLDKASGKYFMWAADDDAWDLTFISKCVKVMNNNPDVVLCATNSALVNAQREIIRHYSENVDTVGLPKLARVKKVILGIVFNTTFHSLRRTELTKKIKMLSYYGSDHIYMMQLSYYGSFAVIPEVLFFCGMGGMGSSPKSLVREIGINSVLLKISPSFSIMKSYFQEIISTSNLTKKEKCVAILWVIKRYISPPYRKEIFNDIINLPLKILGLKPVYR
jgi:glycosyltransferase involved in cell wall biosynthesis